MHIKTRGHDKIHLDKLPYIAIFCPKILFIKSSVSYILICFCYIISSMFSVDRPNVLVIVSVDSICRHFLKFNNKHIQHSVHDAYVYSW